MSLAVLIAIITIGISSYSIYYSHHIFNKLSGMLNIFEGNKQFIEKKGKIPYEVILFGYHRIGYKVGMELKNLNIPFIVVDYNPKVILALAKEKINCIYGDASDKEFLNELNLNNVKLIISTIPDSEANFTINEKLKEIGSNAVFIATTEQPRIAIDLYKSGADYVVIPQHLGGDYVAHMIKNFKIEKSKYRKKGEEHYKDLKKQKNRSKYL